MKGFAALMRAFAAPRVAAPGVPVSPRDLYVAASDATAILEARSGVVVDVNPAAIAMLGAPRGALIGARLGGLLTTDSAGLLAAACEQASREGRADPFDARTANLTRELKLSVASVRAESNSYLLVHLAAGAGPTAASEAGAFELITQAAEAFLVTDPHFVIRYCNPAFARLAKLASPAHARGAPITRWIPLGPEVQQRLVAQMAAREAVTVAAATLVDAVGGEHAVELHTVAVPDGGASCFGFWIRSGDAARGP